MIKMHSEEVYPKFVTAWLCATISTDGSVNRDEVFPLVTSEKEWAEQSFTFLKDYGLACSLQGPHYHITQFGLNHMYRIYLCRRPQKWQKIGSNQYVKLINSIRYWGLENTIMTRKWLLLQGLEEYLKNVQMGHKISEETKAKIRKAMLARKRDAKGRLTSTAYEFKLLKADTPWLI